MATWRKGTGTVTSNGIPIANVTVYVYEKGTTNYCTIYSDEGVTPIDQAADPILSDAAGRYAFYLDVDTYQQFRIFLDPSSAAEGYDFDLVNADLDGISMPSTGATGAKGDQGIFGGDSFGYVFSTETGDADPGSGKLRYNNADPSLATEIYIDDEDENAVDIQAWLRTLDDSTSTIKGRLRVFKEDEEEKFATYNITAIAEEVGYFKLTVTHVASASTFSDADGIVVSFAIKGDKGDTGEKGDEGEAAAGFRFYLDDEADEGAIDSYKRWRRAIPAGAEATLQATAKSGDPEELIGVWITTAGVPGIEEILAGDWLFHLYLHMDSAAGDSRVKIYVYKRTVGGAETEIFNVTTEEIEDTAVALNEFIKTVATDTSLLETDRLVMKAYFYTDSDSNKTVTLTYDGTTHVSYVHSTIFTGAIGGQGIQGEFGGDSFEYVFSDETGEADPGSGKLRYNNADPSLATEIYIDDEEANAVDIQAWLRTLDDSTSTNKGHLRVFKKDDSSKFATYSITAVSEEAGYFKLTVTCVASNDTFSDADEIVITFAATGDAGALTEIVQDVTPQLGGDLNADGHSIDNVSSLTDSESRGYGLHLITTNTTITLGTDITDSLAAIETYLADKLVAAVLTFQLTTKTYSEELDLSYVPMGTGGEIIIKGNGTANTIIDGGSSRSYCVLVEKCRVGIQDLTVEGSLLANVRVSLWGALILYGAVTSSTCTKYGIQADALSSILQDPDADVEITGAGSYAGLSITNGSVFNFSASSGTLIVHGCTYEGITVGGQGIITIQGNSGDYTTAHVYSNGRDGIRFIGGATGYLRYMHIGGNTGGAIYAFQQPFLNLFNVTDGANGANGTNGGAEVYAEDAGTIRYSTIGNLSIGSEGASSYSIHIAAA